MHAIVRMAPENGLGFAQMASASYEMEEARRMKQVRLASVLAAATAALLGIGACSSSTNATSSPGAIGGSVTLWGVWQGAEQQAFAAALQPFESETGITVDYTGKGNAIHTALQSAIQGGSPPDVSLLPDPGTVLTLAKQGTIKDLTGIVGNLSSNYGPAWNQLITSNGKLYGVWFRGANKNTIWYNPAEFAAAGITSPPTTWEQLIQDAGALKAAGNPPFSLCTDIGWPVANFWQNTYLRTAGAPNDNTLSR